jgi:hypothetical protein
MKAILLDYIQGGDICLRFGVVDSNSLMALPIS